MIVQQHNYVEIAKKIEDYLAGHWVSLVCFNESRGFVYLFSTSQQIYSNWSDSSNVYVRPFPPEDGQVGRCRISFSLANHFWTIYEGSNVHISQEGLRITYTNHAGDRMLDWIKREYHDEGE